MYARNITIQASPDRLEEVIQLWRESVVQSAKQQKGFKKAYLLVDRSTGKGRVVGLWETEADLQASAEWNQGQVVKFAGLFTAPPIVEQYEVAVEV